MRINICGAIGKFVQISFAQQDAAGPQKAIYHCRVFFGYETPQNA